MQQFFGFIDEVIALLFIWAAEFHSNVNRAQEKDLLMFTALENVSFLFKYSQP